MEVIYTYGAGWLLWKVLNGVALVYNTKLVLLLSSIAGVIGGLSTYLNASFSNSFKPILKSWAIPSFALVTLLFIPKVTVDLIDKVDPNFRYSAVKNVPIGIVLVSSFGTQVSAAFADTLGSYMSPAESISFHKTGDLFGAKLVSLSKDLRLTSPIHRANIKKFVDRCFTWPYVYGNSQGLKEKALTTNNILGFIKKHPHHWTGSYWEEGGGRNTYKTCREGALLAETLLAKELPHTARTLSSRVFNRDDPPKQGEEDKISGKLLSMIPSAWESLIGKSENASSVLNQFIMINAYKESKDDGRESSGLTRLHPELVSLQAARGIATATLSDMISAEKAGAMVPLLQGAILAFLIAIFPLIVAMSLLPGGFSLFMTWVKLMMWVCLWPVFFVIFESLAMMALSKMTMLETTSSGGLSLATHSGLTETATEIYAHYKRSLLAVPVVSWMLISRSSHAITGYVNGALSSVGAGSEKAASEVVDGNMSFDTQSLSNRTMGSVSMGQQTLGPSLSFGSRVDTGGMALTYDGVSGTVHGEHHASQMKSNVASNDSFSATLSKEMVDAQAATHEKRSQFEAAQNKHVQSSMAIMDSITKGDVAIAMTGKNTNYDQSRLVEEAMTASKTLSKENELASRKTGQASGSANVGLGLDSVFRMGVSGEASITGESSEAAINKIAKQAGWDDSKKSAFSELVQNVRSGNVEARLDNSRNLVDEQRSNFENATQASENLSASLSYSRNLQKAKGLSDRGEISVSSNLNDDVISHVAKERFGGDSQSAKVAAHEWASKNDEAWIQTGANFGKEKAETLFGKLKGGMDLSEGQVLSFWNDKKASIPQNIDQQHDSKISDDYRQQGSDIRHQLQERTLESQSQYDSAKKDHALNTQTVSTSVEHDKNDRHGDYMSSSDQPMIKKTLSSLVGVDKTLEEDFRYDGEKKQALQEPVQQFSVLETIQSASSSIHSSQQDRLPQEKKASAPLAFIDPDTSWTGINNETQRISSVDKMMKDVTYQESNVTPFSNTSSNNTPLEKDVQVTPSNGSFSGTAHNKQDSTPLVTSNGTQNSSSKSSQVQSVSSQETHVIEARPPTSNHSPHHQVDVMEATMREEENISQVATHAKMKSGIQKLQRDISFIKEGISPTEKESA